MKRRLFTTLIALASLTAATAQATSGLTVSPSDTKQQVLFIGADMERSQGNLSVAKNKKQIAEWCFKDIDFNVCRVSYDKKQEEVEGVDNREIFYSKCVDAMRLIRRANPNVRFWATLKSDYYGYGNPPDNNLPNWICDYEFVTRGANNDGNERGVGAVQVKGKAVVHSLDTKKYAKFLVDYLEHFDSKGLTIEFMSTGKEWTQFLTAARTKEVIEYMIPDLISRKIPIPKFIDASTWSAAQGARWVDMVTELGFEKYYYGFCTHNYNSKGTYNYENMVNKANAITTPNIYGENRYYSFASETSGATMGAHSGVDYESSMDIMLEAYRHKCEIFADGMHGELIFEIFSRNKSRESRAVYFSKKTGYMGQRLSHYYALKSHGNFFQDGMYYLGAQREGLSSNVHTMQFANDKQMYVAIINMDDVPIKKFRLSLGSEEYNGAVHYHEMAEKRVKKRGDIDGRYFDYMLQGGVIEVEIPAKSVNFFKIDLSK